MHPPDGPGTTPNGLPLLETGCGLVVGYVRPDGAPLAGRAWGVTLLDGGARARVIVDAADVAALGYPPGRLVGVWLAVTGGDVQTLATVQAKGPVTGVEPTTAADRARLVTHCDAFFSNVEVVDMTPRRLMERLVPREFLAVELDVVDVYDQTPGPNAGTPLVEGVA
jgi:hypothetical protein